MLSMTAAYNTFTSYYTRFTAQDTAAARVLSRIADKAFERKSQK